MNYEEIIDQGLTVRDLRVLQKIKAGARSPSEICDRQISGGSMTQIADKLIYKGLICRLPHEDDRRKYVLTLTDYGRELIR